LVECYPNEICLTEEILKIRKGELRTPSDDPLMLRPMRETIEGFS
jgi:hypothetical protein